MVRLKIQSMMLLCLAVAMASCATPQATPVVEAPVKKPEKAPEPVAQEPELPPLPSDDAPRVPGMLNLPTDTEFRPSNPVLPKTGAGGVIIRPPTDPPSRVKPKEPAPE
jgi:hypothetical protein